MQDINEVTDVTLTTDVEMTGFSPADLAKHVQMKSIDSDGNLRWTQNYKEVALETGDGSSQVTLSYDDMSRYQEVRIKLQAQNQQTVNTEVLKSSTQVLLRPDMTVDRVDAQESVRIDEVVNIAVFIKELNGDLGAINSVSLSDLDGIIDSVGEVVVDANGDAGIIFSVAFSEAGTQTLTVNIDEVVPRDFDTGNNQFSFTIDVVNQIETVQYYMSYYWNDFNYHYDYASIYGYRQVYDQQGQSESFYQQLYINEHMEFPIDVHMTMSVDGGADVDFIDLQNIQPTYSYQYGCYDYENSSTQVGDNTWVYVYNYDYCGSNYSYVYVSSYAADYVYYSRSWYSYWGGYNYEYNYHYDYGDFINAKESITTYTQVTDDTGQTWGGEASISLTETPYDYSYDYSYYYYYLWYHYSDHGVRVNGYGYGMTAP
ncbi:MAG: hypothetical protein COB04_11715 [Gammaproteobacteria bacterium]|nr:MAG: hypothetical protein COB04_11715 [Gammaproteobacteria bacterium]